MTAMESCEKILLKSIVWFKPRGKQRNEIFKGSSYFCFANQANHICGLFTIYQLILVNLGKFLTLSKKYTTLLENLLR